MTSVSLDFPQVTISGDTVTGVQNVTTSGTRLYGTTQTNADGLDTYTMIENGSTELLTDIEVDNLNIGTKSSTVVGNDQYTLSQVGTQGDVTFSINGDDGSDRYTTTEQDNLQTGNSTTTTNGAGSYTIGSEDVTTPIAGSSPPAYNVSVSYPSASYSYSDTQSANAFADTSNLSQSGSDRYSALMSFNNTADDANAVRGGIVYSPIGLPEQIDQPSNAAGMIGQPGQLQILNGFVLTGDLGHDLPVEVGDVLGNWTWGALNAMGLVGNGPAPQTAMGASARASGEAVGQLVPPALRIAGGVLQIVGGGEITGTGVGSVVGWATIGHGVSDILAGLNDAANGGGFSSSPISWTMQQAGVSPQSANSADAQLGIILSVGVLGISGASEAIAVQAPETENALFSKLTTATPSKDAYLMPVLQSEHATDFLDLVDEINNTPSWQAGQVNLDTYRQLTGDPLAKGGMVFKPQMEVFAFTEDATVLSALEEDVHWNTQILNGRWLSEPSTANLELETKMEVWSRHSQFFSDAARKMYAKEIQDAAARSEW